ncbi:glutamate--cysteine ligase [Thalassiella azotivora]
MRSIGVEEELLLVDVATGRPRALAGAVLRRAEEAAAHDETVREDGEQPPDGDPGGALEGELQQQQVETDTKPHTDLGALEHEVVEWRARALAAAQRAGAKIAAVGTAPTQVSPRLADVERYQEMAERFGVTTDEQLTCGLHVHVSIDSEEEAVAVIDRIRVWLPSLLALSANSPFWQGRDTGYESFRSQVWTRWPSAGPTDVFGSAEAYRSAVQRMLATGVLLDEGMVYFTARASHRYPTVELRAADVCMNPRDTVLIAALARGLVETAAREWAAGEPVPDVPTSLLRLADWRAGRSGVDGELLHPEHCGPRPAREVLEALVDHVRPALQESGDDKLVDERLEEVLRRGTGARFQRQTFERTGNLVDVVAAAARVTAGQE